MKSRPYSHKFQVIAWKTCVCVCVWVLEQERFSVFAKKAKKKQQKPRSWTWFSKNNFRHTCSEDVAAWVRQASKKESTNEMTLLRYLGVRKKFNIFRRDSFSGSHFMAIIHLISSARLLKSLTEALSCLLEFFLFTIYFFMSRFVWQFDISWFIP